MKRLLSILLVLPLLATVGCYDLQSPKAAKEEVAKADRVRKLMPDEINRLFQLKRESGSIPFGEVFEATGKVVESEVKLQGQPAAGEEPTVGREYARIRLFLPDYAAATVTCRFDPADAEAVRKAGKGHNITVRGKLSNRFHLIKENVIDLNGCIIVSQK